MNADTRIKGLYAIADTRCIAAHELVRATELVLRGGARVIQYRDKGADPDARLRQAGALAALCAKFDVPFIVNDDVDLAARIGAAGAHLGHEDLSVGEARERLGGGAIIGVSCYNDFERAVAAQAAGADYVAFGSLFPSRTKPAAVRASEQLLRKARNQLRVSIVAIGGITPDNGDRLIAAGANALAVIDGVFNQSDITTTARRYAALFNAVQTASANHHIG